MSDYIREALLLVLAHEWQDHQISWEEWQEARQTIESVPANTYERF